MRSKSVWNGFQRSTFNCDAEVHSMYLDKWRFGLGRLKLLFLQFVNDLRDSALISELHARQRKTANKVDDMHLKVDDIFTILFKIRRLGTRPVSEALARQEIPLKPEIFHRETIW